MLNASDADRDAVLGGDFADALGDDPLTLGDDDRGLHFRGIILDGDGEVSGVGDHRIGSFHRLHLPGTGQFAVDLPASLADVGISFHLPHLLANLLLGQTDLIERADDTKLTRRQPPWAMVAAIVSVIPIDDDGGTRRGDWCEV